MEDERIIALAESMVLAERGYAVETACSGEDAIRSFGEGLRFDLVLMDIDLGSGPDGTEVAQALLGIKKVPIVFLSSHSSREMVEKVRGITRYGYVVKNSGEFVMISAIEMALELFAKENAIEAKDLLLTKAERAARIGYWSIAPGASAIELSPGCGEILGIDAESCSFEAFRALVEPDCREARDRAFDALMAEGRPYDIAYRVRRADDGSLRTLRSTAQAEGGAVVGVLQDVSEIAGLTRELCEAEEREAVTLRSIGDGVIATDTAGRVVELNRAAESLTGWRTEEAAGRPIEDVFRIVNVHSRDIVPNPVQEVIESGRVVGLANHTVLISRGGAERHIADSAAPIREDGGAMLGMVLVFRDVTEEYEARKKRERDAEVFRVLFEESHTPMLLICPGSGAIRDANRAAQRFYGWSVESLRSMSIDRINTLPRDEVLRRMGEARGSEKAAFRFVHRLADGSTRSVLVVSGPVILGDETCLLSIVHDASAGGPESLLPGQPGGGGSSAPEARHRWKDGMQIVSSLIHLHASESKSVETLNALGKLQADIAGLALVYDQPERTDGGELVRMRPYLLAILDALGDGYLPSSVSLKAAIDDCSLCPELAMSLGLIVNELVMSVCGLASAADRAVVISVGLEALEGGDLVLMASYAGAGLDVVGRAGSGFGLVRGLVSLERGRFEVASGPSGIQVSCRIPAGPREGPGPAEGAASDEAVSAK